MHSRYSAGRPYPHSHSLLLCFHPLAASQLEAHCHDESFLQVLVSDGRLWGCGWKDTPMALCVSFPRITVSGGRPSGARTRPLCTFPEQVTACLSGV